MSRRQKRRQAPRAGRPGTHAPQIPPEALGAVTEAELWAYWHRAAVLGETPEVPPDLGRALAGIAASAIAELYETGYGMTRHAALGAVEAMITDQAARMLPERT